MLASAGVQLRGPEDEDGPDLDSPGRAHERSTEAEAANEASAAADAALPHSPAAEDANRERLSQDADRADPAAAHLQRTYEERKMEAEAMLAGLEQDPVRVFLGLELPRRLVQDNMERSCCPCICL